MKPASIHGSGRSRNLSFPFLRALPARPQPLDDLGADPVDVPVRAVEYVLAVGSHHGAEIRSPAY